MEATDQIPATREDQVLAILRQAKQLAQEYRQLTGKPLGITGDVAEYEAAHILGLRHSPARQAGYDAIEEVAGATKKLQIKGRCLVDGAKPGQRVGAIRIETDWDLSYWCCLTRILMLSRFTRLSGRQW